MNGNFYQNPTFPNNATPINIEEVPPLPTNISFNSTIQEQSYIENILRLNKGKRVNAYFSFPDSKDWQNKIYSGIIEEAGKDHLIISDPETGKWYLIRIIYLDYIEFIERINYNHDYSEKTY